MKKILLSLLILLYISGSCGARKTNKTIEKKETKTEETIALKEDVKTETNVKEVKTVEVDSSSNTVIETVIYTPIDPTKVAVVTDKKGVKHELHNSSLEERKTVSNTKLNRKDNTVTDIDIKSEAKKDSLVKKKTDAKSNVLNKNTEREAIWFNWWWWIVIVIIACLYLYYRISPGGKIFNFLKK